MGKFNVVQKQKRRQMAERKRLIHGDPTTGKLQIKAQPLSISGKRKRKLFKKWRREQKDALQKGLVTMEDVEMAVAEGTSEDANKKIPVKSPMKKVGKTKIKKLQGKSKGKGKRRRKACKVSEDNPVDAVDAMVE